MQTDVQQYFLRLPENKREVAMQLHDIFMAADARLTTSIKWNNPTYTIGKTSFAFIYTYKSMDYVNLAFFNAVELSDPKKLFEGTGKGMRHIKVKTVKDIPAAQIKKWVKEAILLLKENISAT